VKFRAKVLLADTSTSRMDIRLSTFTLTEPDCRRQRSTKQPECEWRTE